jgi:hypothetical protein
MSTFATSFSTACRSLSHQPTAMVFPSNQDLRPF